MFCSRLSYDKLDHACACGRYVAAVLATLVTLIFHDRADAQGEVCGPPPQLPSVLQSDELLKGQLEGEARILSGLAGKASLGGQIESARKKLYQNSDRYFAAQKDAYLAYIFCALVMKDQRISTEQKIRALQDFRRPLGSQGSELQETNIKAPQFKNSFVRATVKQTGSRKIRGLYPDTFEATLAIEIENVSSSAFGLAFPDNQPRPASLSGAKGRCDGYEISGINAIGQMFGDQIYGEYTSIDAGDRLVINYSFRCPDDLTGTRAAFTGQLLRLSTGKGQALTVSMSDIAFR